MPLTEKIRKNLAVYLPSAQRWLLSGFTQGEIETIARHVAERVGRNPSEPLVAFARSCGKGDGSSQCFRGTGVMTTRA